MSSKQVRDAFETAWGSLMPGLPLEDTINVEPDRSTLPDNWASVEYFSSGDSRISVGAEACWREIGVMSVVVFVLPGLGDSTAVDLADQVRNAFRDWRDPTKEVRVYQADPPESGGASDGRWFAASVALFYQYDRVI